jgi:cellulose synthase/poly-beta-1,6-N-acetylglucosamine synthase-like glycosyltransferase
LLKENNCNETNDRDMDSISVIYLSQNGDKVLQQKIQFLLNEISVFSSNELIVIDDCSIDNSLNILNQFKSDNIQVIHNDVIKGIPNSMNTGIKVAKYDNIVFCDQRQSLTPGIINKLVTPLRYVKIGIVSACISNYDKNNHFSIIRAHENSIKQKEARTGNLIGVYGPLYALKKECYTEIPDNIIMDDLYLTLNILQKYQVIFLKECQIVEENLYLLYSYDRARRYLKGFFQIFTKKMLSNLSSKQIIMLFWHKYFRLIIPLLILSCFIMIGMKSIGHIGYLVVFTLTMFSIFILPWINTGLFKKFQIINLFLISLYYTIAFFDIIISRFLLTNNDIEK